MTEEENKAIECLKIVVDDINECGAEYYIDKDILSDIQIVLNLIEKLQKENLLLSAKENMSAYFEFKRNYILKDKIRELFAKHNINISEDEITVDGYNDLYFIDELKELLEEE